MTMNNSDILFLYDAKLTNPNGDADDENRPRMDYERSINLVSDVRLKRYVRDYLENKGHEIFVAKVEDQTLNATNRLKSLFEKYEGNVNLNKITVEQRDWMLDQLIDVRLFGATMPIKSQEQGNKGSSMTLTGPVQFNWGYSLNKVSLVESSTITSHFSSEESNERGAMGKDYRVYYSFIAFHGVISASRAKHTRLKEEDIYLLDEAMIRAIPLLATRSKVGQQPRLYLRVEYNSDQFILGDLRDYIRLEEQEALRSVSEVRLIIDDLVEKLVKVNEQINTIHLWQDQYLTIVHDGKQGSLDSLLPEQLQVKCKPVKGAVHV